MAQQHRLCCVYLHNMWAVEHHFRWRALAQHAQLALCAVKQHLRPPTLVQHAALCAMEHCRQLCFVVQSLNQHTAWQSSGILTVHVGQSIRLHTVVQGICLHTVV